MLSIQRYGLLDLETEIDPLEDRFKDVHVAESLDDLVKRVTRLEEKVEDLIKI